MTMLDILKKRLPEGLEIAKVIDKANASQIEIWFAYRGMKTNCWLSKTCAPGHATKLCDKTIATAMLGFAIQLKDMDLCQYFGQKKLKYYADFFSSSSSLCCGVI